jgi:diguanylate cyclase (GGDEF)-like protein
LGDEVRGLGRLKHFLGSIHGRMLSMGIVIVVPCAVLIALMIVDTNHSRHQIRDEGLKSVAQLIAIDLSRTIDSVEDMLFTVVASGQLQGTKPGECPELLSVIAGKFDVFTTLSVMTPGGAPLCSVGAVAMTANLVSRPYFQSALQSRNAQVGAAGIGRLSGRPVVPVAIQYEGPGGDIEGVLVVGIDLQRFLETSSLQSTVTVHEVTLWNGDGLVLAHSPFHSGIVAQPLSDRQRTVFRDGLRQPATMDTGDGAAVGEVYATAVVGAFGQTLFVTVGDDASALYAEAQRMALRSALGVTILLAVVLGLSFTLASWSVRQPVGRLVRAAERLTRGEAGVRAGEVGGADELRRLGEAFDEMATALEERRAASDKAEAELRRVLDDLEHRVEARTRELSAVSAEATGRAQALEARKYFDETLARVTELIQACQTMDEAMLVLEATMPDLTLGRRGAAALLRQSRDVLEVAARWGDGIAGEVTYGPEACWSLRLGRAYAHVPGHGGPGCRHVHESGEGHVCVPVFVQGQTLGVVTISTGDMGPGASERFLTDMVAAIASIGLALFNVRLRQSLRELSIRDPLTGLHNRRFAEEVLEKEFARARRSGVPFSVLMMDVDHFKRFNDSHGHEAGDRVLKEVGQLITREFREGDVGCRFGGEEFLVLLHESDAAEAFERADHFRQVLRAVPVVHAGELLGPVTISIGVAEAPRDGGSPQAVVAAADAALYRAKAEGRDRVVATADPRGPVPALTFDDGADDAAAVGAADDARVLS